MTHLEQLIKEWFEFQGYFVRANLKVGKRERGGHADELDIIAFHPVSKHLIHVEASIDPYNWEKRNNIFRGKFERGRRYFLEAFPWLDPDHKIEQWAVLWASDEKNKTIGDGMGWGAKLGSISGSGDAGYRNVLTGLKGVGDEALPFVERNCTGNALRSRRL